MNMKKPIIILSVLFLLTGCSSDSQNSASDSSPKGKDKKETLENDYFKIDGVYLDSNDTTSDDSLRNLYIFYTYEPKSENLKVSSAAGKLTLGKNYEYTSDTHKDDGKYMPNYYCSSYIEDVYGGSSLKTVSTFEIPPQQLDSVKEITFLPYGVEEDYKITFKASDVQKLDNAEAIAQVADPDGYAAYQTSYQEADEATTNTVRGYLNGFEWDFYVNTTSYQLEFFAPNQFEMRAIGVANDGSYVVRNGYITLTYDSNGYVVDIPYTIENNDINLDVTKAFDVQS